MERFSKQKIALRYWLKGRQYFKALKALEFASRYHVGMRKDKATPEFSHQIAVASFIRSLHPSLLFPEDTIAIAFLHDVTEDYNVHYSEIEGLFGEEISKKVGKLDRNLRGGNGKKSLENYYLALSEEPEISIVKGSDRIHNFQTMTDVFSIEKQKEYIDEGEKHILPMLKKAKRLFPEQEMAYENIKHVLISQIELIRAVHSAKEEKK